MHIKPSGINAAFIKQTQKDCNLLQIASKNGRQHTKVQIIDVGLIKCILVQGAQTKKV